jgi:hypothetical protein
MLSILKERWFDIASWQNTVVGMEDAGNLHAGSFEKSAPRNFAMQKDMQKR